MTEVVDWERSIEIIINFFFYFEVNVPMHHFTMRVKGPTWCHWRWAYTPETCRAITSSTINSNSVASSWSFYSQFFKIFYLVLKVGYSEFWKLFPKMWHIQHVASCKFIDRPICRFRKPTILAPVPHQPCLLPSLEGWISSTSQ
jgi:hypothetical protein